MSISFPKALGEKEFNDTMKILHREVYRLKKPLI